MGIRRVKRRDRRTLNVRDYDLWGDGTEVRVCCPRWGCDWMSGPAMNLADAYRMAKHHDKHECTRS